MSTAISGFSIKVGATHGDVRVTSGGKLTLIGAIAGTLTVESGGYANIIGLVHGLVIEPGGRAKLRGTCMGDASNQGGDLEVRGIIKGALHGRSITRVMPGAKIGAQATGGAFTSALHPHSTWPSRRQFRNSYALRGRI